MEKRPYAKKSLGQNFLHDGKVITRIVDALALSPDDTVIEIGPGRGALTGKLIESGSRVIAVELDRTLVPLLEEKFAGNPRFTVVETDVLEVELPGLLSGSGSDSGLGRIKLVGNLPYYISTAIIQKLAKERSMFSTIVLMLQREVAERIRALSGNSERGYLTVLVESAFESKRLIDVAPTAFRPVPKVWSSVVRLTPRPASEADDPEFLVLLSRAFAQKRKTILNNLKPFYNDAVQMLSEAGIDKGRRAETLIQEEWLSLFQQTKIRSENSI